MIHLSATRMNGVPRCMGFIQNLLLQSFFIRYNEPLFEPQGPFRILAQTSDLRVTFWHPSLDMTHTFVILQSSYDLIPQGRYEDNAEQ
jgi:hypothetical protein